MNRPDLEQKISVRSGIPIATVHLVVTHLFDVILEAIRKDEKVMIRGIGSFMPRIKSAAKKFNPTTGKPMRVPKRRTVVFRPSAQSKTFLNGRRRTR